MNDRAKTEAELAALKLRQQEVDKLLVEAREDTSNWCEILGAQCFREKSFLDTRGDVADYELSVDWRMLGESIRRLRLAQENSKRLVGCIEDLVADLADDDLWQEPATEMSHN